MDTAINGAQKDIPPEQPAWIGDFVQNIIFSGPGAYTIFGNKPMSGYVLSFKNLQEAKKNLRPFFSEKSPEERLEAINELEEFYKQSNTYELWEKWMQYKKRFPKSSFLFRIHLSDYPPHTPLAEIVNIQEMAWTLHNSYSVFKQELGRDFDPLEVTLDFENPNSAFWKDVFANHLLLGIAYGFGERNAFLFATKQIWFKKNGLKRELSSIFLEQDPEEYDENSEFFGDCSIEHLCLPAFKSYPTCSGNDPVLDHYKAEKNRIQKLLRGTDLTEEFLKKMNSSYQRKAPTPLKSLQ